MMDMMDGSGWSWIWGGLMMLLFWGGPVVLIVLLVRAFGSTGTHRDEKRREPEAKEILAERFARGEISEDEFEERRRVLERRPS